MVTRRILITFIAVLVWSGGAGAVSFDDLLKEIEQKSRVDSKLNREREAEFLKRKDEQAAVLSQAREQFKRLSAESDALEARFEENKAKLADLTNIYRQRAGDSTEIFSLLKRKSAELATDLSTSFVGLLMPHAERQLERIAGLKDVFNPGEARKLWRLMIEEMVLQGASVRTNADVVLGDGRIEQRQLTVIGPFTAISGGRFLQYPPDGAMPVLVRHQPASRYLSVAEAFERVDGSQHFAAAPLDPSRGAMFSFLEQSPGLLERIEQGGAIALIILALGAVGFALVFERIFSLRRTARAVSRQKDSTEISSDNPLGRVMQVCEGAPQADYEETELRLQNAVLKEVPRLERGFGIIKVLTSIAPLLGLLGTVVGMIETFQAITLFGSGDPQVMAGGISQALVTTMLGLSVAIPLLLLYVAATGYSRRIRQVLEEQSAGILAARVLGKAG